MALPKRTTHQVRVWQCCTNTYKYIDRCRMEFGWVQLLGWIVGEVQEVCT